MNENENATYPYQLNASEATLMEFFRKSDNGHKKRILMLIYKMDKFLYGGTGQEQEISQGADTALNEPIPKKTTLAKSGFLFELINDITLKSQINKTVKSMAKVSGTTQLSVLKSFFEDYKSAKVSKKKCVDGRYETSINRMGNSFAKMEYDEVCKELYYVMTEFKEYRYCYDFHADITALLAQYF